MASTITACVLTIMSWGPDGQPSVTAESMTCNTCSAVITQLNDWNTEQKGKAFSAACVPAEQ
ncbi:hypothetical protein [Zavarzinia sp. CC-PAN008]|uniref:hypothetical protein n=1 Tax=Zavarzinia sp. CC-PAN008 TaxID=3243332 RepID=UPI003F7485DD